MDKPLSQFSGGIIPAERLAEMEDDSYWDEETAMGRYRFPLPVPPDEQEATEQQAESLLTIGIPPEEVYCMPPFTCAKSPQSHKGPYRWAVDFLVLDGTDVLAAADGVVVESIDRFARWGDDPALASEMNLVTVRHEVSSGAEFTQYCHLARGSVCVRTGEHVRRGQKIAEVGKVGWTDRDHLHFVVFRNDARGPGPYGFKSLKVRKFK